MATFNPKIEPAHSAAMESYISLVVSAFREPSDTSPLTRENTASAPDAPGIYGIFESGRLLYVGETGCLKKRLRDLFESRHHTFRRKLGKRQFHNQPGFHQATTVKSFPPEIEQLLTAFMRDNLRFIAVPIHVGRKEIEERIVVEFPELLNARGQRRL